MPRTMTRNDVRRILREEEAFDAAEERRILKGTMPEGEPRAFDDEHAVAHDMLVHLMG